MTEIKLEGENNSREKEKVVPNRVNPEICFSVNNPEDNQKVLDILTPVIIYFSKYRQFAIKIKPYNFCLIFQFDYLHCYNVLLTS